MTESRIYLADHPPKNIWAELKLPNEDAKVRAMVKSGFSVELLSNVVSIIGLDPALGQLSSNKRQFAICTHRQRYL